MLQMSSSSSSSPSCLHQPGRKPTGRAGQGAGRRKRRQRWTVHGQTERRIDGWIEAVDPSDEILGLGGWDGREVEARSAGVAGAKEEVERLTQTNTGTCTERERITTIRKENQRHQKRILAVHPCISRIQCLLFVLGARQHTEMPTNHSLSVFSFPSSFNLLTPVAQLLVVPIPFASWPLFLRPLHKISHLFVLQQRLDAVDVGGRTGGWGRWGGWVGWMGTYLWRCRAR